MTPADQAAANDRYQRERREADRRYNDALTALDRAVVEASERTALDRGDFARVSTALIVFLQQITAFVESKDRETAANADARVDELRAALNHVAELRTHVNVIQRAVHALSRTAAPRTQASGTPAPSTPAPSTPAPSTPALSTAAPEHIYVAFEDEFRGSDAAIGDRVRAYVPIFLSTGAPVVDLGCGRGELLAALRAAGIEARGVDANGDMASIACERGVDATRGDALAYLESCADQSLGGVVATQVVEHLEPAYLIRLLEASSRKLRAGAPIVLETINPACWLAFFSSYIRDLTHVRPVHPDTLQYLLRANGFERVEIRYSAPVPDPMKMKTIDVPEMVRDAPDPVAAALTAIAHTVNTNAVILNSLMFTHLDYAAVGFRA